MKQLHFVTIFPDDAYFSWQCHLWLESLREIGHSDKAIVLIFTPSFREVNKTKFERIIALYPEAQFHWYKDEHQVSKLLGTYIPILRPYTAWRFWKDHPEMKDKAVFYCDSDILFMKEFNLDKYLDDDINYLSDTNSYINATYFDSKVRDVKPDMLEEYKTIDVLDRTARLVGITREVCEANNNHSGGAQYLLKNLDAAFWFKMMNDCISIITYLRSVNKDYFESENKGFQAWCADMWSLLWNLWLRGQETKVIPEMAFAWATDSIDKLKTHTIFHNAGITNTIMDGAPCFYKGKYHQGSDPMVDPFLDEVLNDERSKKKCTWFYASKLDELRKKYKLTG